MASVEDKVSSMKTSLSPPAEDTDAQRTVESTTNVAEPVPRPAPDHSPNDSEDSQMSGGEHSAVDSKMLLPLVLLEK